MYNRSWDQVVQLTEEYAALDTAICGLAKILQELGYGKFSDYVNYSFPPRWFVKEIGILNTQNETIEVTFQDYLCDERENTVTVKIPMLWLQMEDPREEIQFHMKLAGQAL